MCEEGECEGGECEEGECEGGECEGRLTGAVAAVCLSCRPSSNPPLASLTRHTLLSDWSKSFNKYAHIPISMQYKHNKDGDAFPHYGFKGRSDDAGVSQGKLRWGGDTSSKYREGGGSVVLVWGMCGGKKTEGREEGEEEEEGGGEETK